MADRAGELPDYETPPVVEVVCGVEYEPILALQSAHLGVFWSRLHDEFPLTQDLPRLPPIGPEEVSPQAVALTIRHNDILPRVWFTSPDERKLLQVQRDRLHFNWRHRGSGDEYPRFESVYSDFVRHRASFDSFLEGGGLPPISPVHYELVYVNRVPVDEVWDGVADIGRVLRDVRWQNEGRVLPVPTQLVWEASFPLPDGRGTLWVKAQTVRAMDTGAVNLALHLTARGRASSGGMDAWFQLAREWIVRGFADLATDEIQRRTWRRRDGEGRGA